MRRNLIISGGIFHPFDDSSAALSTTLTRVGIESDICTDVLEGIGRLASGRYAMLTINALRWGMMTADKYEPYRAEWAFRMPDDARSTLSEFVNLGGGLLGLHTASICFDDWQGWCDLLGAQWQWGSSYHPELAEIEVRPTRRGHSITTGIEPFRVTDEVYHHLRTAPRIEPLVMARTPEGEGEQPVVWARNVGNGRAVYDALGHDADSINQPMHARLLRQSAEWLTA